MLTVCLIVGSCRASEPAAKATLTALVLKVVDGDTVDIIDDARGRLRVRVLGIDTPETKRPRYTVGCGGPEATRYAESVLSGQRVAVEVDPGQDNHDRYGRTLAALFLADGSNYAVEAVRSGHARAYVYGHRPSRWASEIMAAERQAKSARIGIWGPPCRGHTESARTS
ncbi:thermonuclease family protein [Mycobacteroides abscessus]|uniref:thermonuclease family protein n=1 Tax=Mycobacteroides abscessus TaxID=36809 RepID=UPI000DD6A660|nr:thermonuclease family protein [Mycobacteroides abscessus]